MTTQMLERNLLSLMLRNSETAKPHFNIKKGTCKPKNDYLQLQKEYDNGVEVIGYSGWPTS